MKLITQTSKAFLVVCLLALGGCASATMRQKFDSNEYTQFVDFKSAVEEIRCSDNQEINVLVNTRLIGAMTAKAVYLMNYTKYIDPTGYQVTKIIYKQTKEMLDRYQNNPGPTVNYCQIKVKLLDGELDSLLTALGKER